MKGGKYARTLAKNQFFGTFHIRAVSEEMFCLIHRDLYGDAMMAVLPDGHQHGGRKPAETVLLPSFATKA